ncbi:MAG TPA: polysaccharide biosynthesis/export family protein [Acidobacteriaceae bacterium]|nr:polysaccharide biosynthesis/export family protein [Acidobacteriaceae bacterium]
MIARIFSNRSSRRSPHPSTCSIRRLRQWLLAASVAGAVSLPLCCVAQFAGPAPTKSDSPQPLSLSLTRQSGTPPLPAAVLRLHTGDLIEVTVYGVKDYDIKVRIDNNGEAYLPLIAATHLDGLSLQQGQQLIADKLDAAGMIRDPQVTITVTDSVKDLITITGEVDGPKAIPAYGELHLLDIITAAGGLKPTASHTLSILRPGAPEPLLVQLGPDLAHSKAQNVFVYPGDQIIVPRTGVVYVVGAVKLQNAYPLVSATPMTLMQAVSMAGGVNFEAEKNEVRIIRTIGATRQEIPVDLKKVMYGKVPDPVLQNDDIVFVPTNVMKAAIKGGGASIALGLVYALNTVGL